MEWAFRWHVVDQINMSFYPPFDASRLSKYYVNMSSLLGNLIAVAIHTIEMPACQDEDVNDISTERTMEFVSIIWLPQIEFC